MTIRSIVCFFATLVAVSVSHGMEIQEIGGNPWSTDISYKIVNPLHRGSALPIGFTSEMNGVCRYLGFERYAQGSAIKGGSTDTVHINEKALGDGGPIDNVIDHLVCLNRAAFANSQKSAFILAPKHADSGYSLSFFSSGIGVCRYFHYAGFANGSLRKTSIFQPAVLLDEAANVVSVKTDLTLKSALCFFEDWTS